MSIKLTKYLKYICVIGCELNTNSTFIGAITVKLTADQWTSFLANQNQSEASMEYSVSMEGRFQNNDYAFTFDILCWEETNPFQK